MEILTLPNNCMETEYGASVYNGHPQKRVTLTQNVERLVVERYYMF